MESELASVSTKPATNQTWLAPAKLNLFLHITGRRPDGYHSLQTVFQLLDFGDELSFEVTSDGVVAMRSPLAGLPDEDNLIIQSARLLKEHSGCQLGVTVDIKKNLPMGGGLGGGSSDAATTLRALNALWQTGLSLQQLAEIGLQLGADVPVFVHGRSAWAEGVGENLQAIDLPECWYAVVNPGVHVSTAELFSHPQLTRDCAAITIRGFHSGVGLCNVFQPLVSELYFPVCEALDALSLLAIECNVRDEHGAIQKPRLTGTGACVFLACDSQEQAQNVLAGLRSGLPDASGFVARGISSIQDTVGRR